MTAGLAPPHDLDAEAAVLSAVLLDRWALDRVLELLKPEQMYAMANGSILEAAADLSARGQPVDIVTIASWLRSRSRLEQVGGAAYLAQLADATPSVANVVQHANVVLEKARVRAVILECQRIASEGYGDTGDAKTWIAGAEERISALARTPQQQDVSVLKDVLVTVFQDIEASAKNGGIVGTRCGFEELDRLLGGMRGGTVTVVAGRPGQGKTALAMNVAANVAFSDNPEGVVVFSEEMVKEELGRRMIASEARVNLAGMRANPLTDAQWGSLAAAGDVMGRAPLWIEDLPALRPLDIRSKARRVQRLCDKRKVPLGLLVVDYLQLLDGTQGNKNSHREQEISYLSRTMKQIAKELGVPIMLLSQLNRGVESRPDKRPMMSDLRESGAIEQDADNIVMLYRDEYYHPDSQAKGIAEALVVKQRAGATGKALLKWTGGYTRFDDLKPEDYPDAQP